MTKTLRALLAVSVVLSAGAFANHGQIRDLRLATVQVSVADKGGPIRGLTSDDFQLFVNGERAPIEFFEAVTPRSADPLSGDPFAPGKIVVILFDVHAMAASHVQVAQVAAEKYLEEHMRRQDLFAVAEYGRSLQFTQTFTQRPEKIVQAIRRPMTAFGGSTMEAGFQGAEGLQLGKNALLSLTALCRDLSQLSGRKSVLVFTEDFAAPSGDEYSRLVDAARRADVSFYTLITTRASADLAPVKRGPAESQPAESRETGTVAKLSSAPVAFSRTGSAALSRFLLSNPLAGSFSPMTSLQQQGPPSGVPTGPTGSGIHDPSRRQQATAMDQLSANLNVMQSLSEQTDGDVIRESNNLTDALVKLDPYLSNYYRLGFFAPASGERHKIEVKTPGRRARLRYGKSNYASENSEVVRQSSEGKALAAALDSFKVEADPSKAFGLRLRPVVLPRTRDLADVVCYFHSGEARGSNSQASTVIAQAYREDGSAVGGVIARDESGARRGQVAMTLPPGAYRVRLGVAGDDGRGPGIAEERVVVPPFTGEGLAASSLVVAAGVTPLPALIREAPARFLDEQHWLAFKGYEMLPSVDGRVSRQKPLALFFKLHNLKSGWSPERLVSDTRLADDNGEVFLLAPVTHVTTSEQQGSDCSAIGFSVSLSHLKPGRYHVTVYTRVPGDNQTGVCKTDILLE